jgi:hypothetical protein
MSKDSDEGKDFGLGGHQSADKKVTLKEIHSEAFLALGLLIIGRK